MIRRVGIARASSASSLGRSGGGGRGGGSRSCGAAAADAKMLMVAMRRSYSCCARPHDNRSNINNIRSQQRSEMMLRRLFSSVHGDAEFSSLDRLVRTRPSLREEVDEDEDFTEEGEGEDFMESGDPDPRTRLGRQLLRVTRVPYRKPEPLPPWMQERIREVTSHRTSHQIRRCLKDWMIKSNRETQNSFFNRKLEWSLQGGAGRQQQADAVYAYGPEETVSYCHYFVPGRFGVHQRLFRELKLLAPDFVPRRMLDFGCGPGTAGAAAVDIWGPGVVQSYAGVDSSQSMLDAANIVLGRLGMNCSMWNKISDIVKRAIVDDSERFDLIVCSYTLTELANDASRRAAVQILFELLDVGGMIMFLEKGNPEGSFAVRTSRQFLLDMHDPMRLADVQPDGRVLDKKTERKIKRDSMRSEDGDDERGDDTRNRGASTGSRKPQYVLRAPANMTHAEVGAFTIAPCTHDKPCPLSSSTFCSFSQKVFGGMIRDDQAERFSYVLMQKRKQTGLLKVETKAGDEKVMTVDEFLASRKQRGAPKEMVVSPSAKVHRRRSGGPWLSTDEEEQAFALTKASSSSSSAQSAEIWPTPLSILKRFRDVASQSPGAYLASRKKDESVNADSGVRPSVRRTASRRGVRDEDDEGDVYSEDEDDGLPRKNAPKTAVDFLIDDLIDEVDWEEYEPSLHRNEWARVLRPPLKNKGHIIMDLCVPDGSVIRSTFSRSNLQPVPQLYRTLRKTSWGGMFPVGMGDDDAVSVLTRNPRRPTRSGLSAQSAAIATVAAKIAQSDKRAGRESHKPNVMEETTATRRVRGSGVSKSEEIDLEARGTGSSSRRTKAEGRKAFKGVSGEPDGDDALSAPLPLHSSYRRSKEFLEADRVEAQRSNKRLAISMLEEQKGRRMAKLGEAFRRRQEERRLKALEQGGADNGDVAGGNDPNATTSSG